MMQLNSLSIFKRSGCRPVGMFGAVAILACVFGLVPAVNADAVVDLNVVDGSAEHVVLEYEIGQPTMESVEINGSKYVEVFLGKESRVKTVGVPALPNICRSVIIPDDAQMKVNVLSSRFYEINDIDVAPSKGYISRQVSPKEVPYTFGAAYDTDAFFPADVAVLRDPYIMRNYRGVVVEINPLQYNPITRTLRVYTNVSVEVVADGVGRTNVFNRAAAPARASGAFHTVYRNHFVNYDNLMRYDPIDEVGDMLIICYDAWLPNIQPLADHKNSRGINTTVVGVSTIGNNDTAIKAHIQSTYNSGDLAFVLLVGDAAQVDTPISVSGYNGASDPKYSLLAGSDNYPEIMIGRFSAESADDVDTQVERTIAYETMPATSQDWFWKGVGIASAEGTGDDNETDIQHMNNIRADLLAYGYTLVDQIYDPGASPASVTAALNNGRGIVNYTGHGGPTSWGSSDFYNSHVNALTNAGMLPFIVSVACNNGEFDAYTCFGEAWLRATDGSGEPTGAVGAYMSSLTQPWDPPMEGQDEFNILYTAEAYTTYGALCYAGSSSMMDDYPGSADSWGNGLATFNTWHIFGDPSLRVVMSCTDAGTVSLDRTLYGCEDTVNIQVIDCGLNLDDGVADTATVIASSQTEPAGESIILTEIDAASGQFMGSFTVSGTDSAGVLAVTENDTITVTYVDADDGAGGTDVVVTDDALVDCTAPVISSVEVLSVGPRDASIAFSTDEPARGTVHYGTSCGTLTWSASGAGYATDPQVGLTGLDDNITYFFAVEAEDEAGNSSMDNNGGACYQFTTPEVPNFFTENFDDEDNDLAFTTVQFTPGGGVDFYIGCSEAIDSLPTDPAGGTSFSMSVDDYEAVNLTGGATVSLYGTDYSTFYVGSNGYITFIHGDTDWNETLEEHFSGIPRISALYDDLNVSGTGGGTISWKQLSDRAVVTWEDVPEYTNTGSNTFQIEMFFNGVITLNYLAISANDGIVGLSEGTGLDDDYLETDLSEMGLCIPLGDCDIDGDTDEDDLAVLWDCFSGPGGGVGSGCGCVNFDGDNDVDCKDWREFAKLWSVGEPPSFAPCSPPTASAAGSRFLSVSPAEGNDPVALLVTGDPTDPAVSCISLYVQTDGSLGDDPVFRLPSEWGTALVSGAEIGPSTVYNVQGDYGTAGAPKLSPAQSVETWVWADIDNNLITNLADVQQLVLVFKSGGDNPLPSVDQAGCELDGVINMTDIQWAVSSFQGKGYWDTQCSAPCGGRESTPDFVGTEAEVER